MSGTTPRFGLNWFDGDSQPGSLSDDGQKYTGDDRLLLDRLLAAIENHDHSDPDSTDPSPTPEPVGLSLTSGSGALEASKTYFYRVSFVDRQGTETPASDEASIDTPDRLTAPAAPSATTDPGGTLPAGLYFYALTAVRGIEETPLGEPISVTVLVGEGQVTLTPPSLGDATAFYVWRMNDADGQWARFSSTISFGDFVDDGSVSPTPRSAPSTNTGVSNYSVSVTLDTPDQTTVQNFAGWKIYRTETSGTYGGNSLVEKVTTRTVESDPTSPLVTSFTDAGDALLPGSPPPINQGTKMRFVKQRLAIVTELPTDLSAYPQGFPLILVDGSTLKFYVLHGTSWELAGGGGSGAIPIGASLPDPTSYAAGSTFILVNGSGLHLNVTNGFAWTAVGSPTLAGTAAALASGNYVGPKGTGINNSLSLQEGSTFFLPFVVESLNFSFSAVGLEVVSATTSPGASVNFGLFEDSAGKPGASISSWGSVLTDTTGWRETSISWTPTAVGRYWIAVNATVESPTVRGYDAPTYELGTPSTSPASVTQYAGYGMVTPTFPPSGVGAELDATFPILRLRVA